VLRVLAGIAIVAATLALSRSFEQVDLVRFALCWWGVLLALSGAVRMRHGWSPFARPRDFVACAAASVLFWDLFELLNLRLHDWWYVGVPRTAAAGAAFSAVCYATVLPAARYAAALALPRSQSGMGVAPAKPDLARPLFAAFGVSLALVLALPRVAFPLAWLLLWFLFEAELARRGDREPRLSSPLEAWRAGDRRTLLVLLAVALPIGLCWEGLNYGCERGWVYTVPHFESWKLFEMPLPGYLGYLPFLLECGAALAIVAAAAPRVHGARAVVLLVAIAGFHWEVERLGRRATALSVTPRMDDARTLTADESAWLRKNGLETPLDVLRRNAPAPEHVRALAELSQVKHMGVQWAERLMRAGISSRDALAVADVARLHQALSAQGEKTPEPAIVRLWVRAAAQSR
jgi:Domain of unknown function (DUF4332)